MRRPGVTMFPGWEKRSAGELRAWEYGDPAEVVERREDEALGRVAAERAREEADQVIEAARVAALRPLSPITRRAMKRMRIRELMKGVR